MCLMDPDKLHEVIRWLEHNAGRLPSLVDMSDADMALMYLRHLAKHLEAEKVVSNPNE